MVLKEIGHIYKICLTYDIIFVQEIWLLDCELHFLNNLSSEFTVYARTGVATSVTSGIVKGRPYGGVAVFVRNNLSCYVAHTLLS